MKLKVHPLFFALALLLVLFGQAYAFLWAFAAVVVHELGHTLAARARGYVLRSLTLLPYGAELCVREEMDGRSCVIVGLAGPAANFLCCGAVLALWWLFPAVYPYTRGFLAASFAIGAFNLLPVYPLDGARVVLGTVRNRLKAAKGMQAAGVAVAVALLGGFLYTAFSGAINFTLGVLAVFLFYGATLGGREHSYVSALAAGHKNYSAGVRERRVFISENAPLVRLFHHIDSRSVTTFAVVSDGGESDASPPVVRTLTEAELRAYAAAGRLSRTIASCIKGVAPEVSFRRRLPVRAGHCVGHFPRPRPREGRDS